VASATLRQMFASVNGFLGAVDCNAWGILRTKKSVVPVSYHHQGHSVELNGVAMAFLCHAALQLQFSVYPHSFSASKARGLLQGSGMHDIEVTVGCNETDISGVPTTR
jgi:hypothetical protein